MSGKRQALNTEEQMQKLNQVQRLADGASSSPEVVGRLGAFVLYSGMVDFMAIQAARLLEQVILKERLATGKATFQPHEDTYFYDSQVSTRGILGEFKRFLPFESSNPSSAAEAKHITESAERMLRFGHRFLNDRNLIVHHIGNPEKTFDDIIALCDKANKTFREFQEAHTTFFKAAAPYRFSESETRHFYAQK